MKKDEQNLGIEKYAIESIPTKDWQFTKLLDDIIMCEYIDADESGVVMRNGLYLSTDASKAIWRVGRVILAGPEVPDYIKPGTNVMFPNDKGIPSVTRDGTNLIFLNVDRIFGVVEALNDPNVTEHDYHRGLPPKPDDGSVDDAS